MAQLIFQAGKTHAKALCASRVVCPVFTRARCWGLQNIKTVPSRAPSQRDGLLLQTELPKALLGCLRFARRLEDDVL